jgi:glycine/serine hydroxymethyltransferase
MVKVANWIDLALRNKDDEAMLERIRKAVIDIMAKHPYLED